MRTRIIAPAIIVLAACQQAPVDSDQTGTPAPAVTESPTVSATLATATPAGAAKPANISLAGEWRVAAIDGTEFNEPYGLALSGSDRELWWSPRCAALARSYRIDGGTIRFGPRLDASPPGAPPQAVCEIAPPPRIDDVLAALDAATTVSRTTENGLLIAGEGRSVLLFSQ